MMSLRIPLTMDGCITILASFNEMNEEDLNDFSFEELEDIAVEIAFIVGKNITPSTAEIERITPRACPSPISLPLAF
jgi:hypothetical protein